MYLDTVRQATLFRALHLIDVDLAQSCQEAHCVHCNGPLHDGSYKRKPRGGPPGLPDEVSIRLSLCCGRKCCRKRTLPPSCLFLGRKVYWGAVVLVTVAMRQRRPGSASAARLRSLFGVSWETVKRWMTYFAEVFPKTEVWKRCRGLVCADVRDDDLPAGLIELLVRESGNEETGLVHAGCHGLASRDPVCQSVLSNPRMRTGRATAPPDGGGCSIEVAGGATV